MSFNKEFRLPPVTVLITIFDRGAFRDYFFDYVRGKGEVLRNYGL